MAVDTSQVQPTDQPAPAPAPALGGVNIETLLLAVLGPQAKAEAQQVAQQAVDALKTDLALNQNNIRADLSAIQQTVQDHTAKLAAQAVQSVAQFEPALLHGIATTVEDPKNIRIGALIVLLTVCTCCVIELVAYLQGNPYAGKIIAAVPAVAVPALLAAERMGVLPMPTLKK